MFTIKLTGYYYCFYQWLLFVANEVIQKIIEYLHQNTDIDVVWLYGSHAKGTAQPHSDIDLAIAFKNFDLESFDMRLRPKELELEISNALNLNEQLISIVDINIIPSYLAFNVIEYGKIIISNNSVRAMKEQQRIYSQFEFETIASKHD